MSYFDVAREKKQKQKLLTNAELTRASTYIT